MLNNKLDMTIIYVKANTDLRNFKLFKKTILTVLEILIPQKHIYKI